jgi:LytS/YehU family sensor histidine kinase
LGIFKEKKDIWKFGSTEVGIAAAFGGLGFAGRVLGLVIPIAAGFMIDMRAIANIVVPSLGGPMAGIIVGILSGLPSSLPVAELCTHIPNGIIIGYLFRSLKRPYYYLAWVVGYTFQILSQTFWVSLVLGFVPWKLELWMSFLSVCVSFPINIVLVEFLRRSNPSIRRTLDG